MGSIDLALVDISGTSSDTLAYATCFPNFKLTISASGCAATVTPGGGATATYALPGFGNGGYQMQVGAVIRYKHGLPGLAFEGSWNHVQSRPVRLSHHTPSRIVLCFLPAQRPTCLGTA